MHVVFENSLFLFYNYDFLILTHTSYNLIKSTAKTAIQINN